MGARSQQVSMIWTATSISSLGARLSRACFGQVFVLAMLSSCSALKAGEALPSDAKSRKQQQDGTSERQDDDAEPDAGVVPREDPEVASHEPAPRGPSNDGPSEEPQGQADATRGEAMARVCADLTTSSCETATWPDNTIRYAFADTVTDRAQIRSAMDRWERAAARAIRFVEAPEATAKVTLHDCGHGGRATGFDGCEDGCDVALCEGAIHHELGRLIGLTPHQRRSDRDHYLRVIDRCDDVSQVARCTTPDSASDLGPFDYASSLLPPDAAEWMTRWDGAPLCESAGVCRSDGERFPTALDGSALIERSLFGTGWGKFRRTFGVANPNPPERAPLRDDADLPVRLARDASPALETWGWASLAIYARGENDAIYKKYYQPDTMTFSSWLNLEQPSGLGDVSDPAIAGWAAERSHLVVRRGTTVYIRSNENWMAWESLGGPESLPESAPAITSWGEHRLDIVVRAQDDRIYHKYCTEACVGSQGAWSEWMPIDGAAVRGKPAIVARAPGKLALFAHGVDGQLWFNSYDADAEHWGTWEPLPVQVPLHWDAGCPDCASPAAGARSSDSLDLYVRGRDQLLWTSTWTERDGFGAFVPRGGVLASSPATISTVTADGRADVVAILEEEHGESEPHRAVWWKAVRP